MRLAVGFFQLILNVAHGLFKVEVLVFLFEGGTDVAARSQASVIGFDLSAGDQFDQPFDVAQFSTGKAFNELPVWIQQSQRFGLDST